MFFYIRLDKQIQYGYLSSCFSCVQLNSLQLRILMFHCALLVQLLILVALLCFQVFSRILNQVLLNVLKCLLNCYIVTRTHYIFRHMFIQCAAGSSRKGFGITKIGGAKIKSKNATGNCSICVHMLLVLRSRPRLNCDRIVFYLVWLPGNEARAHGSNMQVSVSK